MVYWSILGKSMGGGGRHQVLHAWVDMDPVAAPLSDHRLTPVYM